MIFKKQVEKELERISKKQQIAFAWRSAICALPFLGTHGHFNFWGNEIKQDRLYTILRLLDLASISQTSEKISEEINAELILTSAIIPANTITTTDDGASYIASYVSDAVFFSASAFASSSASSSASACTAYAAAATAAHYTQSISLFTIQNIQHIKENTFPVVTISSYGKIWDNFQKALIKNGCKYWANWYQNLFENNFEFDIEEVQQRLHLPKEIVTQGAAAVGAEMERFLQEGGERLNEARVIILGDKGVGKTCIARKLQDPEAPMTKMNESTPGVDTTLWKLETDTDPINVRIWDFAGHTVTHAAHQFFLSERSLYILVYDGRSEERNRLRYWLDHVKNYGGTNSKAIILVNEQDAHTVDIPINTLQAEYPIEGIYSFNIKSDTKKLQHFREVISRYIIHNPSWEKQRISKSYYQVKNELETLFANNEAKDLEFIQKAQYLEITQKYKIDDPEGLLMSLHALGISLWYPGLGAYNMLILNPEWISDGVYKIINWVNNQEIHTVLLNNFSKIFNNEEKRFPKEKYTFLFDLMIKYELAYTLNGKRLVIPHLLKEDQPKELPDFPDNDSLLLHYEANQVLPPNTISRFIVRHHTEIQHKNKKPQVWRYGVILEDETGSIALVKEKDRVISVAVKGNSKTNFISNLRKTLNDIFDTYKSLQPKLSYKIIDERIDSHRELFLTEQKIVNHVAHGQSYYDDISNQMISLGAVKELYKIFSTANTNTFLGDIQNLIGRDNIGVINNTTLNFNECSIDLQGNINDLIKKISKTGDPDDIEELQEISELLEKIEDLDNKKEIEKTLKKKNIPKRFARIFTDLGDKNSTLYKTVEGGKRAIGIAQDIAEEYNKLAQWLAWPQVPTPFLKKKK